MSSARIWYREDIELANQMLDIEREGFKRKKGSSEAVAKHFGITPGTLHSLLCKARKNPESFPFRSTVMGLDEILKGLEKVIDIKTNIELINSKPEIEAKDRIKLHCLIRRLITICNLYSEEFEKFLKVSP